jgi:hypothetical protein
MYSSFEKQQQRREHDIKRAREKNAIKGRESKSCSLYFSAVLCCVCIYYDALKENQFPFPVTRHISNGSNNGGVLEVEF